MADRLPPPTGNGGDRPKNGTGRTPLGIVSGKRAPKEKINRGVRALVLIGAGANAAIGDTWSAHVWEESAGTIADAWTELAAQNAQVNRVLSMLVEGGMWGAVITSSIAMLAPVISYHFGPQLPGNARFILQNVPVMLSGEDALVTSYQKKIEEANAQMAAAAAAAAAAGPEPAAA